MKKLIIFAVLFAAAFSLQAQKDKQIAQVDDLNEVVNKITKISGVDAKDAAKKKEITLLIEDFIVENPDAITKIRTKKAIKGKKTISQDQLNRYIQLQREAHDILSSSDQDKKAPRARGMEKPSEEQWKKYWTWLQEDPERIDASPGGYVVVTPENLKAYQRETGCDTDRGCMNESHLWQAMPIVNLVESKGGIDADR